MPGQPPLPLSAGSALFRIRVEAVVREPRARLRRKEAERVERLLPDDKRRRLQRVPGLRVQARGQMYVRQSP